jgi:hypothetical protein
MVAARDRQLAQLAASDAVTLLGEIRSAVQGVLTVLAKLEEGS